MFSIVMSIHYIPGYMCFFKALAHQIESWLHRDPSVYWKKNKKTKHLQETLPLPWEPKEKQQKLLILYFYISLIYFEQRK